MLDSESYPFFSIITPTYNRAKFLPRCLLAYKNQTFLDYEVIIVDDGSTDNSKALIEQWTEADSRIRYFHQENRERGAARNHGIGKALGRFIVFCDSDDEMLPHCLQAYFECIHAQPQYRCYAMHYKYIFQDKMFKSTVSGFSQKSYDCSVLLKENPFSCNVCVRNEQDKLILFSTDRALSLAEDWIFLLQNFWGERIYFIDQLGVLMHEHDKRSILRHQDVIVSRMLATKLLISSVSFSNRQKKKITGYSYYISSVHAYLDGNRLQSLALLKKAQMLLFPERVFTLASVKYLAGKPLINQLHALRGIKTRI